MSDKVNYTGGSGIIIALIVGCIAYLQYGTTTAVVAYVLIEIMAAILGFLAIIPVFGIIIYFILIKYIGIIILSYAGLSITSTLFSGIVIFNGFIVMICNIIITAMIIKMLSD